MDELADLDALCTRLAESSLLRERGNSKDPQRPALAVSTPPRRCLRLPPHRPRLSHPKTGRP